MTEQEPTATDEYIDQVLPGPCCGRFVPQPEEIDSTLAGLGIERTAEHPEFAQEPEEGFELEGTGAEGGGAMILGAVQGMGNKMKLPSGTPRHFPPFPGATQQWSERTRNQVMRIRRKAPGIVCASYRNHGRTGEAWGIDIMVSPFHQMAQGAQKQLGNALTQWLVNNWAEMNLNYVIWFNQMNDGAGWFNYEPYRAAYKAGSSNLVTSKHQDHVHVQVLN